MADILSNFDLYPELVAAFVSLSSYGKYRLLSSMKSMRATDMPVADTTPQATAHSTATTTRVTPHRQEQTYWDT